MCMPDAHEGFLSLSGSSVRVSALLPGDLGVFDTFRGILMPLTVLCA